MKIASHYGYLTFTYYFQYTKKCWGKLFCKMYMYSYFEYSRAWVYNGASTPQEIYYCRAMNPILLLKYHWDYGIYFQHFLLPDCQKRHKCCSFLCIHFKMGSFNFWRISPTCTFYEIFIQFSWCHLNDFHKSGLF